MKSVSVICLLLFSTTSFAMFCPSNFKNIDIGDSLEQVLELCGPPTTQKTYKQNATSSAEEWTYYKRVNPLDQSTAKMVVVIQNDQVININIADDSAVSNEVCQSTITGSKFAQSVCNSTLNSQHNVGSTQICGAPIQIGDHAQTVETACGKAVAVTAYQQPDQPPPTEIVELDYDGPPKAALLFENKLLVQRNFL
jgi:hypothetical protein